MLIIKTSECPYISKTKASITGTDYFCEYDGMGFDSMLAHCRHCEMFNNMLKNGITELRRLEDERNA